MATETSHQVSRIQPRLIGISQSSTSSIENPESSIESFIQNKPNLLNTQINVSSVLTKDYENSPLCRCAENKPKQTQFHQRISVFQAFWGKTVKIVANCPFCRYNTGHEKGGRFYVPIE